MRFPPLTLPLILCLAAPAQARQAVVSGRVVDESGQPVARAQISVRNTARRVVATTFTYPDGTFRVQADAPAECTITAALPGFVPAETACTPHDATLTLSVAPIGEAVVVTATRSEAPASQIASSVTVFDEGDLARRQNPLAADLLRSAPGVTVVRSGGAGNVTSLFVRGGESNYTKVLLDGIPINEPGGTFNFSNVTTGNLERVELVRGAQSALFGSDAMSGVVQLFTRRGGASPTVDLTLEGGGYSTARASAGLAGRHRDIDYSLFAARLTTDNRVPNDVFRNSTFSAAGGAPLGANARLRAVFRGEIGRTGVPGATAFGRPDLDASFDRRDLVGGVTFEQQVGRALHHRATYALSSSRYASTNLLLDPPYTPRFGDRLAPFPFSDFAYDSTTDLRRHHVSYQADARLPVAAGATHLLTAAFEWDGERATLEDRVAVTSSSEARDNFGWTFQHEALWPRLFATAGMRIERNDSFGTAVVPRASAAVVLRQSSGRVGETRLKAAAGLGIKEPTILQSFSQSPLFLGNPALDPERSRSVEAGVEQRFAGDRVKAELTWFDSRYRDIISTRTVSFNPFVSQYFNVGLTRARGIELSGEVAPFPPLVARAGYTLLDSRILESTAPANPVFAPGMWLFRRPRHSGYAELSWAQNRLAVDVSALFVGTRVDSDFSSLQPPLTMNEASYVWDLRGSYRVTRHLAATAAIDNATNAQYFEPLGFPAPGRVARAGVRVTF